MTLTGSATLRFGDRCPYAGLQLLACRAKFPNIPENMQVVVGVEMCAAALISTIIEYCPFAGINYRLSESLAISRFPVSAIVLVR